MFFVLLLLHCFIFILVLLLCWVSRSSLYCNIPSDLCTLCHKRIQHPNVKKSSKPRTLQDTFNDLLSNIQKPLGIHHIRTILFSLPVNYLKDLRDFGLDKGGVDPFLLSTDCLVLYVFLNQFDLNLFMIATENSSIFRLLTKESMLLTSASFLIEKRS